MSAFASSFSKRVIALNQLPRFKLIFFCHLLNDRSGSPTVLSDVIEALTRHQPDSKLFVGSQGKGILDEAKVRQIKYFYIRSGYKILTLFTYLFSQVALFWALSKEAKKQKPELVFVNTLLPFGAAIWAKSRGIPVVYHIHEVSLSPRLLQNFLIFVAKKTASRIVYVSYDQKHRLNIQAVPGSVVHNAISKKIERKSQGFTYKSLKSGTFEVLMLASLKNYKGVPEFINLARELECDPQINFTLVLNAEDAEIREYFAHKDLPLNVSVHSKCDNPAEFYQKASVLLNLSRPEEWIETFGMTLIEAMSFGVPVIAPEVGGPTEIITDGVDGFQINGKNLPQLKLKIFELLQNSSYCAEISNNAKDKSHAFSKPKFEAKIRKEILEVLSQ